MMYNQKLAAAIKVNGNVLREFKDTVYIPFGSEYTILIKNLNTVKAIVNVTIDGEDMIPGGLVLSAGQEVDLERSIKNNNLTEGNRFKFIERTGNIERHRGVKLEDGLVRIEYQFEKPYVSQVHNTLWGNAYPNYPITGTVYRGVSGTVYDSYSAGASGSLSATSVNLNNIQCSATSASTNDVGITVAGSKSDQKFTTVGWFPTETEKHVMVFKLLGATEDNQEVVKPVTVKHKPKCTTCGKQNRAHAKFCTECGTALEIFA